MLLYQLTFTSTDAHAANDDTVSHHLNDLLAALRMNGQIAGREWGLAKSNNSYITTILVPAEDAFHPAFDNHYVRQAKDALGRIGLSEPILHCLGTDIDGLPVCACTPPPSYILYTNYLTLESPIRCGGCFNPIPLYHLPKLHDDSYYPLIRWQSDHQACDLLFMNSTVLERATHHEMSNLHSRLGQDGRASSQKIAQLSGVPTYYYLNKHHGKSRRLEELRMCPSCGNPWLLESAWHLFDFRCEQCYLVSNIAWSVR